jgi:hypothetical protein
VCEAKPRISSDWLISSSKLQPCLELCRFAQALLKTEVARWKVHFLIRIGKRPLCNIRRNGWCITQGTQPKRRKSHLESHSYNKSHPSPKACCFSKIIDKKPFLVCLKSLLDSLSSTCMSSTPTKYTPWFASNIKPYHAGSTNIYPIALLELMYR